MANKFANGIKLKLDKIVQENFISTAYIFYGPDHVGKKETAVIVACRSTKNQYELCECDIGFK